MSILKNFPFFVIFMAALLVIIPQIIYAYMDPASINFYLQVLAGGLVGIIMGVKFFWNNIKSFFIKVFGRKQDAKQSSDK